MVDKFNKIIKHITKKKGDIFFFGIFKMDEFTDKWSVIICADWITVENMDDSFAFIAKSMKGELTEEEGRQISRIGIFSEDEHLIELLSKYKSGSRIQDEQVNGNIIHDGHVLISNAD